MPPRSSSRTVPGARGALAVGLLVLLAAGAMALPTPPAVTVREATTGSVAFVNISATETFAFVPSSVSVPAGATIHLIVTQAADFNHTFTLSPVANFSFAATAGDSDLATFFGAHAPLVNLSLGSTTGSRHYANFTLPATGSFEFVCLESGHFASGMHGTLATASGGGGDATSSAFPTTLVLALALVGVVVIVVAVLALRRRR